MKLSEAGKVFGVAAVFALLTMPAGNAVAATYIGAAYGWQDGENSDFEDSTANGWRAFLGASASGVVGWEVGYGELSEFQGRSIGDLDINAWDASLLGGLPLGPITIFGRVGAVFSTVETADRSDDDWTYRYGVGADAHLGKTFGLRFEWNRTPVRSDIVDVDVDTASAGLFVQF